MMPKIKFFPISIQNYHSSQTSYARKSLIYFLTLQIYLYWTFHINKNIQCMVFCDWLLPLSIVFEIYHIIECVNTTLIFIADYYCMNIPHFIYVSAHFEFVCVKCRWCPLNIFLLSCQISGSDLCKFFIHSDSVTLACYIHCTYLFSLYDFPLHCFTIFCWRGFLNFNVCFINLLCFG